MNRLAIALGIIIISAACVLTVVALSIGPEANPAHTAPPQTNPPPTPVASTPSNPDDVKGGVLRGTDADGAVLQFPLAHTDVRAEVTGNIAQVELTQIFRNPNKKKIEAVYVFPLPNRAAVNGMKIKIGERTIEAAIKKRDDAQRIYEEARAAGHVTALLEQERPNIFTQSVANILPGNSVEVTIRYFETVPYEKGAYTFSFPMVVGPRFIPGEPSTSGGRGWSPNTSDVPDASRITPPVLEPGQRSGHDISLSLQLDAGATLKELAAPSHDVTIERNGETRAVIRLANEAVIPNKDFVLRYSIDGDAPRVALLPHRRDGDGYFLLLVQPETDPGDKEIRPKEMIFVVDGSGSMSGFPIEKVKEAMRYALKNLNAHDTFQIIRFSNRAESFQPAPVPATRANIERGLVYVGTLAGRGGTIMLEGVEAALRPPKDPERLRIVSFMTDGYIGNENEILAYLKTNLGGARLFSFGVGNSVNRYLLDKMAELGRGAVEYVLLGDKADESVARFYDRIRNPYLTDLEIDWGGIPVEDVYPKTIPDLFLGQPVVLHGKYKAPGKGKLRLRGKLGGKPYEQEVEVLLPDEHPDGEAIGTLWARARIEDLSNENIVTPTPRLEDQITKVALAHDLVSAYTSFVAVEKTIVTGSEEPVLVEVPVTMPEGVSYRGVFGSRARGAYLKRVVVGDVLGGLPGGGVGSGVGRGAGGGFDVGSYARSLTLPRALESPEAAPAPPPPPPPASVGPPVRIEANKTTYKVGERIEITITLTNTGDAALDIPAELDVALGTVQFQIVDIEWRLTPHPTISLAKPELVSVPPRGTTRLTVTLNGPGGYELTSAGTYHVVLLGESLGLPNSNTLTIRIRP